MLAPRGIGTEPREPMVHFLKTWPPYWEEVDAGRKTFEVRRDDRDYRVGDMLVLDEYEPGTDTFSGRQCRRLIGYALVGGAFGLAAGHVVLGFELAPGTRQDFLPEAWRSKTDA